VIPVNPEEGEVEGEEVLDDEEEREESSEGDEDNYEGLVETRAA